MPKRVSSHASAFSPSISPMTCASKVGTLRIPSGVIVLGRAADLITPDTGLQTGDVIHALNTTSITSMDALRAAVLALKTGDPVVLQVERSDGLTYLSFEME